MNLQLALCLALCGVWVALAHRPFTLEPEFFGQSWAVTYFKGSDSATKGENDVGQSAALAVSQSPQVATIFMATLRAPAADGEELLVLRLDNHPSTLEGNSEEADEEAESRLSFVISKDSGESTECRYLKKSCSIQLHSLGQNKATLRFWVGPEEYYHIVASGDYQPPTANPLQRWGPSVGTFVVFIAVRLYMSYLDQRRERKAQIAASLASKAKKDQ